MIVITHNGYYFYEKRDRNLVEALHKSFFEGKHIFWFLATPSGRDHSLRLSISFPTSYVAVMGLEAQ